MRKVYTPSKVERFMSWFDRVIGVEDLIILLGAGSVVLLFLSLYLFCIFFG